MDEQQIKFEGWACVELMGHGFEAGFVATQYFGGPAMFRIDTPTLPALPEAELKVPKWIDSVFCGVGTKYCQEEIPGKTCFVGVTTIFRLTPCDEATARAAIERRATRLLYPATGILRHFVVRINIRVDVMSCQCPLLYR